MPIATGSDLAYGRRFTERDLEPGPRWSPHGDRKGYPVSASIVAETMYSAHVATAVSLADLFDEAFYQLIRDLSALASTRLPSFRYYLETVGLYEHPDSSAGLHPFGVIDSDVAAFDQPLQELVGLLDVLTYYQVDGLEHAFRFLRAQPQVLELLSEAAEEIPRIFSRPHTLELRVQDDPMGETGPTAMVLIHVRGDWELARQALVKLDTEWWIPNLKRAKGRLNFDIRVK